MTLGGIEDQKNAEEGRKIQKALSQIKAEVHISKMFFKIEDSD